jgi:hypothetical protein
MDPSGTRYDIVEGINLSRVWARDRFMCAGK